MRYPYKWKQFGVRLLYDRDVYYRDVFESRDVFLGSVASRRAEGAKSPGGLVTNTVWLATNPAGAVQEFASKTLAVASLLPRTITA